MPSVVLHSVKASSVPLLHRHCSPRGVAAIAWRHWRESAARLASPLHETGRLELNCASHETGRLELNCASHETGRLELNCASQINSHRMLVNIVLHLLIGICVCVCVCVSQYYLCSIRLLNRGILEVTCGWMTCVEGGREEREGGEERKERGGRRGEGGEEKEELAAEKRGSLEKEAEGGGGQKGISRAQGRCRSKLG